MCILMKYEVIKKYNKLIAILRHILTQCRRATAKCFRKKATNKNYWNNETYE